MQVCESIGNTSAATNVADGWMMIFPGQGSPAIGMGSDVCDVSPGTKAVWDCASDVSGLDVRKLCQKGPMTRLTKTLYQQLAVTTVNAAMLTLLRERTPVLETGYAGHSAGEYTALYAAGVMDLETLFRAITLRATIMQNLAEKRKGAMYVVKPYGHDALREQIDNLGLGTLLNVCCDNGHQQQVVGGELTAVKTLVNHLARDGVNTIKLGVNGAWHTPLMHDGVALMRQALADLPFSSPVCPLIMNSSGKAEYSVAQIKENLALHLIHTVRWRESMDRWAQMGHRRYLEISNKKILSHLLAEHYGSDEDYHIQHYYHLVGSSVKHAG
ncbi:Malonyl CoA-acyl carrier protein transacylase [Serratia fonticola]|uniref:ACP S-malonyltransferase n=1 Tax=Serratia fonticola TaxID=47917 RepID=UPI0021783F76|nr:ACP S-malonyltransferase [Serratia fonticola]CAI1553387.1 Malonyl CoA-acyl carrier protein transacylase [Serratia fonticola]